MWSISLFMKVLTVRRCKFRSEQAARGRDNVWFFWKFFEVSMIAESSRQKTFGKAEEGKGKAEEE